MLKINIEISLLASEISDLLLSSGSFNNKHEVADVSHADALIQREREREREGEGETNK